MSSSKDDLGAAAYKNEFGYRAKQTTGATKNAARIAELEREIEELKRDDAPPVEYPKWVNGVIVHDANEESHAKAGDVQPLGLSAEEKMKAAEIEDAKHPAAPGVQKVQIVNPVPEPAPKKR